MLLFLKGIIIGIGKIIPGVSGALLAINFNVYERLIMAITNFFSSVKTNIKFLAILLSGIILAIIIGSNIILYLINNYKFITMMFFIGLIIGGTYNFKNNITFNRKNIIIILIITILLSYISINTFNNNYILKNNFIDNIMFFISGIIEIMSSIIPGISGTSLLMIIGMYDKVLKIISEVYNINYIFNNINIYISYGLGLFISFIINSYLISYLLKYHKDKTYTCIFGFSLASIIYLIIITIRIKFTIIEFILGTMLLIIGLLISVILNK